MSAGRITVGEYEDRSARVPAAKTRGELAEVFTDLPEPHPELSTTAPATGGSAAPAPAPTPSGLPDRPVSHRVAAAAVPLSTILAVVLFFVTGIWLWFLLPCAVTVLGGALLGPQWQEDRRRLRHEYRRQRREHRRGR